MRDELEKDRVWNILRKKTTREELTFFSWHEKTGMIIKCRADVFFPGDDSEVGEVLVLDLKSCASAHPRKLSKSCAEFGYHQQAAHYSDVIGGVFDKNVQFLFCSVEKQEPFHVGFFQLEEEDLRLGLRHRDEGLEKIKKIKEGKHSKGYFREESNIKTIGLPGWFRNQNREDR